MKIENFYFLEPCQSTEECINGAQCEPGDSGKYCKCNPGTEGDFCDNIPECGTMVCGTDSKCGYNIDLGKAVCQCENEELSFDPDSKSCKSR